MLLIDRYIVIFFVRIFLVCFLTMLGLFLVADIVGNLAELLRYGKTQGGLWRVLLDYYGPKVPWFFDLIGRIAALVAAIFTVTWLQRNNEFAAIMAAGISRWRIVKPLFGGVVVIALLAALNREFVLPRLATALSRDAKNYAGDVAQVVDPQYDFATDIFFDGESILTGTREIVGPRFRLPTKLQTRGTQLAAARAVYSPATERHPAGFLLHQVTLPENVATLGNLTSEEQTLVFGPRNNDWLKDDQLFVVTDLPFEFLSDGKSWRQFSSTWNLIRSARNPSLHYGTDLGVSVSIHSRFVQPILDVILVFLGLPIVLSRESRNAFVAIGSCMLIVTVFILVGLVFQGMGMNSILSPSLAVWSPLLIFVPVAYLMSEPLRR